MAFYKDPGHDCLILLPTRVKSSKMKFEQLNISIFPMWMNSSDNKMKGQQAANINEMKWNEFKFTIVHSQNTRQIAAIFLTTLSTGLFL